MAHSIASLIEHRGLSVEEAAERVVHGRLRSGDGGVNVLGRHGAIAMVFNTPGMYRGAAESTGTSRWRSGTERGSAFALAKG